MSNPLNSSKGRVWVIEGRARPDHTPDFKSLMKQTGIDQNFGSINPVYDPDPNRYGGFIQSGEFRDEEERPTTSLMSHYPIDRKSSLIDLAKRGCSFDMQYHMGECENPKYFNDFRKVIIYEGVYLENYSTDDLGALQPGEQGNVDETADISAIRFYEFMPLAFAARSPSVVTNELLDVVLCDSPSCGDCETESPGCNRIMAISKAAGGSPSTPADVVFSLDKGTTWLAHDVDTMDIADDPTGIECVGSYVVVISNVNGDEMHIALISEFTATDDPAFTQITQGFVAGGEPNDIYSLGNVAYLCGNRGYIYKTSDPAAGVTVVDDSSATISDLLAIHMLSEEFGVAVGIDGTIVRIDGDLAEKIATAPAGIGTDFQAVFVKSETEWFVGDSNGDLWYTLDGGATWTEITLPGTAPTSLTDIEMSSDSIVYVSATVGGKGEIFISIDGGKSFIRAPRAASASMPNNDRINAIAVCQYDVDFVVGVGLHSDGADGFIVVGND
jgi:photosystem II stability/assembly factor-like uncharacterized protein